MRADPKKLGIFGKPRRNVIGAKTFCRLQANSAPACTAGDHRGLVGLVGRQRQYGEHNASFASSAFAQ